MHPTRTHKKIKKNIVHYNKQSSITTKVRQPKEANQALTLWRRLCMSMTGRLTAANTMLPNFLFSVDGGVVGAV